MWKSIEYLNQLPTLKTVTLRISQIYFTETTVTDTYENKSIAKVLVDSNATMTVPRNPRVVKFNRKFDALDNEILWILKEMQKVSTSTLFVEANVKIEMDEHLFNSFCSDNNIQKVSLKQSTFDHTNEESFIIQYIKSMST